MRLNELRITGLRNISQCRITLTRGVALLVGDNGAGKSALLEGLFLLGRGRSFRNTNSRRLIQEGASECTVFANIENNGEIHRLGLSRSVATTTCRIDGRSGTLSEAASLLPVQILEPGGFALLDAQPGLRRRWLDWGLFHVEQGFYAQWRDYKRALLQRNAALRKRRSEAEISSWDVAFCDSAGALTKMRQRYLERLSVELAKQVSLMGLGYKAIRIRYKQGGLGCADLLGELRNRMAHDRETGTTTAGPHRSDFELLDGDVHLRQVISRGQQKLLVLALMLAQAKSFTLARGTAPILLFDDLFSEMDEAHQQVALDAVLEVGAQTIITALSGSRFSKLSPTAAELFHVEHGKLRQTTAVCPGEEPRD